MGKQKRFQKQTLNSDEDKAMENGAKKLKRVLGFAAPLAIFGSSTVHIPTLRNLFGSMIKICSTNTSTPSTSSDSSRELAEMTS